MLNYDRYIELNNQIKALKNELEALKTEIKNDLKSREAVIIDDNIIFSDGTGKLTISNTKTLTPAAWDLVNAAPDPNKYIKYGTRENLTVH